MIVKNILLTGASSGIGEALALYYAKQPETENIFICGRNQQRLQAVKEVCEKAGTAKSTPGYWTLPTALLWKDG